MNVLELTDEELFALESAVGSALIEAYNFRESDIDKLETTKKLYETVTKMPADRFLKTYKEVKNSKNKGGF